MMVTSVPIQISTYAQSEIDRFRALAEHWTSAAQHVIVSYLTIEDAGTKRLHWAIVRYVYETVRPTLLEPSVVELDEVTVGRLPIDLSSTNFDLDRILRAGEIEIGGQFYVLPQADGNSLSATFFVDNHPQVQPSQARSPALMLSTGRSPTLDQRLLGDFEHRVRSLDTPYDGMADLLNEHLLPITVVQRTDAAIEILLERPAETVLGDSLISDSKLSAKIVASPRIDPFLLKIGVKFAPETQRAMRLSIDGAKLRWTAQDDGLIFARVEQDIGDAAVCQVFLSYAGHHASRWWIGDPTRLPSQRSAFLAQFDKDLTKLREELLSRESRGHSFERVLALVLEELGFDCMYLGEVSHLQEAPDIYCETPTRRVAVIECAAAVTNSSEKLSKLHQRVLRIKNGFATQRLGNVQVNGVLITKHGDAEIEPFIEETERFGLCIVGLSALTRLADGLRFKVQPDALYDELFTPVQRPSDLFAQVGSAS
ncbi:hypothetical protein BM43_2220 [Burkholderia gladioli]|uniref:Restriction endonuclease type IV Mrr domain-containing protein n=1 Tax=Burkholderia gladioli TaxID=28095 RepID=A0AAW3EQR7_BURGA|nr:hypothetical protein BM43_2220 [Burkholderia gladioli]KGC10031.1 hypothetical protein DM48_6675 [Burkholderia gladioli]SPV18912.1 Uncharacterised protein [Burkholderia gladioli]